MKIGVLTVLYGQQPLDQVLDKVKAMGVEAVEIGTGNYVGDAHCNPDALLASDEKAKAFKDSVESRGLVISGLSCHGNPLHPDSAFAKHDDEVIRKTIRLAGKLGVTVVNGFSGCPGDSEGSQYPNWVTCAWPPDFPQILEWQWDKKLIPYWKEVGKLAEDNNVKLAFEMHPGFAVYNPRTLMRLRDAVGPVIGANFDPSHLFWQGIDIIAAIKELKGAIYHFHAKDTYIDKMNMAVNGALDTVPYSDLAKRSWYFRSIGYGHGVEFWKDVVSTLRITGFDGVLSIEHEDALASTDEGLKKAIAVLKDAVLAEAPPKMWWA